MICLLQEEEVECSWCGCKMGDWQYGDQVGLEGSIAVTVRQSGSLAKYGRMTVYQIVEHDKTKCQYYCIAEYDKGVV